MVAGRCSSNSGVSSLPGRCSGRGRAAQPRSTEGVKAARGCSEVRTARAVGWEQCGAGEGTAGGQMTGPHVTSQERPRTSTLCLHGVRSKKPTPADAPYRLSSSASRWTYIKAAAGGLPAAGAQEATRSQAVELCLARGTRWHFTCVLVVLLGTPGGRSLQKGARGM